MVQVLDNRLEGRIVENPRNFLSEIFAVLQRRVLRQNHLTRKPHRVSDLWDAHTVDHFRDQHRLGEEIGRAHV